MPVAPVYNTRGEEVDKISLNDGIFGVPVNKHLLHEAVVMQQASQRRGTVSTKTIGEVSGGGRKPWRQKGTGRARHGSRRSPLWVGGATLFGPKPRNYGYRLPKSVRRLALKSALSAKAESNELIVLDELKVSFRTKEMLDVLLSLGVKDKALIVTGEQDRDVEKSANNIPGVKVVTVSGLNVYDILAHEKLMMTRDAVARVEEVLA